MQATLPQTPKKPPQEKPPAKEPLSKKPHAETYEELVSRVSAGGNLEPALKPKPETKSESKRKKAGAVTGLLRASSGLALFAAGVLFIGWTSHRVDLQMRDEILLQAQMVAQAINVRALVLLSGTEEDLNSPAYQSLKEQLTLIRKANTKCRFIYLMGRRPDGAIFFFVDSEDPTSPDYSPPGETFDEATDDDRRVFATATGNANGGPYKDRWGVWVSAMVPVVQPDGGRLLAVLGMDFNAASWKLDVANRSAMPALPAAFAFLFGIYFIVSALRTVWR